MDVPTIGTFFGMAIAMHFGDREHPPPHFHAIYGEYEVSLAIETLEILDGTLPRRALHLVSEWAELHREELLDDWERAWNHLPLNPIPPLE